MLVYRISSERYVNDLSGEGARLFGGRWNRKGIPAIYTSEHLSLAALEILANTPVYTLPSDLKTLILQIPETSITEVELNGLPADWHGYPAPDSLKENGTRWLLEGDTLVLKVPSAIIESEFNFIINPLHQLMQKVKIIAIRDFKFDGRFKQK